MRLGPKARARLRKRNATKAAAMLRAGCSDMRDNLVTIAHIRIAVKAVGVGMPVGSPVMPQNSLHDGKELRRTHTANGGLSKGIVETLTPADPLHNRVPSLIVPGDPERLLTKRLGQKGSLEVPSGWQPMVDIARTRDLVHAIAMRDKRRKA